MSKNPVIKFTTFSEKLKNVVIIPVSKDGSVAEQAQHVGGEGFVAGLIAKAAFKGKLGATLDTYLGNDAGAERLILVGIGDPAKLKNDDWLKIGGAAFGKIGKSGEANAILAVDGLEVSADAAAEFALGAQLRAYRFDKYKTKKSDDKTDAKDIKLTLNVADVAAAEKAYGAMAELGEGVLLARELVNEPANVLGPVEFAAEAEKLEKLGVKITILTEKEMKKLGMGSLLGVAQGSVRPPRLVVMEWNGGKAKDKPVAFVGKGVVFDTGGISIKPALGMEEMKGDMGGAAAVTGLMRALAGRKAKVNVVGVIGLVENMPDGNAQRPGDIVTSMSGQTIEVINTDAEGRLVLADALYYTAKTHKPRFMINLATLTGAIIVALGTHHAGLFSNDDELAGQLFDAGQSSGEKLWRLPLTKEYDKIVDSKFADMRNSTGRHAGSITAAQFLKRFVGDTPWAHLDIAGTAMDSAANEYNESWASGFGVRLLDRLVRDHYEG
ncbi:leucyl aminopeptidase [Pseudochrobactrum sp. MP213Fo]|uniref:leucyl aminopeptidase n=1 Tax=Pseudochrobactrum sp. MP213Fo TaxID=3022250 RepID=UPI003BA1E904